MFLAGLGWFTLASVLCAAAPSIGWLIAARAVQGIGGALMTPASLAIIEAAFQPGDRTRAIGTWAGFSGVSSAIAPFLGGWLLEAGSWRWIFLINVPVAAAVAWMTRRHVPESRDTSLSGSADWPGALAGVAALATITYAIIVLPGGGVRSPGFAAAAVLALLSSATFAVTEWRGSHPMLPPAIFRPAQFRAANAVTFVVNGALGGFAFVFIPALEIIAGDSPVVAGSALVPVTVVTLLLSGASGRLAQRIGPRPPLVAGCLLCTVASMLAVRIGPHAGYWTAVLPVALLFGLGLASLMPPLTASAMNSAPDSLAGLASGVNNAVARVAGLLWIAALPPITGLTVRDKHLRRREPKTPAAPGHQVTLPRIPRSTGPFCPGGCGRRGAKVIIWPRRRRLTRWAPAATGVSGGHSLAAVSSWPADALDQVLPSSAEAFGDLRSGLGKDGGRQVEQQRAVQGRGQLGRQDVQVGGAEAHLPEQEPDVFTRHGRLRPGRYLLPAVQRGPGNLAVPDQEVDPGAAVGDQAVQGRGAGAQWRRAGEHLLLEGALVVV